MNNKALIECFPLIHTIIELTIGPRKDSLGENWKNLEEYLKFITIVNEAG